MATVLTFVVGSYLLGAVPFGLLVGLSRGVDIRTQGSRNIGATNVGRVLGRKWGYLVLALDIAKGLGPALAASVVLPQHLDATNAQLAVLAVAVAAVLGHVFPVYLGFRGGKGVATTIGVAVGVWPYFTIAIAAALIAYAIGRFASGAVSVGSLLLAATFPVALLIALRVRGEALAANWPLITVAVALALVIIVRHRENIRRLLAGRELKTGSP